MPVCRAHRGGRPSRGRVASLKLWLEYGVEGDLMYDKFPDAEYSDR
jgi:hypothetical protein